MWPSDFVYGILLLNVRANYSLTGDDPPQGVEISAIMEKRRFSRNLTFSIKTCGIRQKNGKLAENCKIIAEFSVCLAKI